MKSRKSFEQAFSKYKEEKATERKEKAKAKEASLGRSVGEGASGQDFKAPSVTRPSAVASRRDMSRC